MRKRTDSFNAKGSDGRFYTVDVWTNVVPFQGQHLPGSSEHLLSDGDELFDVPGHEGKWQIASTGVVITRM